MGIELTRQDFSAISSMFANADENTEIECKIEAPVIKNGRRVVDGKTIRFDQFQRVLNYASQAFYPQTLNKSEVQLDILHDDNRLTLVGMDNILYFCRHNHVITDHIGGSVFVTQKKRLTKVKLHEYDISVKDSREVNLRGDELHRAVEDVISADRRIFRVKNRYTVVLPTGLRFDFTAVKSASGGRAATLLKNLDNMKNDYEIELEVLNPGSIEKDDPAPQSQMIMNMLNAMSEILLAMEDLDFLMKKSSALRVLQDYTQLVYQKMVYNPYDMPKRWFAGPQPVGIERENLLENKEDSPINIHAEYTVTLKADGERHLLYVDGTERAYLINRRLAVIDTGMNIRGYAHSLFDAEVMSAEPPKNGVAQPKDILLFDAYYVKGLSVMQFPLVNLPDRPVKTNAKDDTSKNPSRIREIEAFLKAPAVSHPYRRRLKQFWWPNHGQPKRIYESVQDAFSKAASQNVDYDLDGVIFTPMYMPVGVDLTLESREQLMAKKPKPGGTWRSVLKWKPPTQNTIDFLVREVPYPILNDDGKNYRRFALFCGQQTSLFENSFSLLKNADSPATMQTVYARKQFDAPFLKQSKDGKGLTYIEEDLTVDTRHMSVELDEKAIARAENGDIIHNDMIVEIYFDVKEKRWRPQRVRHDKVDMAGMNSYNTALGVWKTTLDPITKNNVTGIERVTLKNMKHDGYVNYVRSGGDADKANEPYYMESQNRRDQALTYPLKTFHNRWVKEEALISKLKNKGIVKLMDPVVGQGGDLPRYINAGIPIVLGTDLSEKNIYKQDGANDRLLKQMRQGQIKGHWRYVFLPMDFSKPITKTLDNLPSRDGENDATLLKILWGRKTQLPPAVFNHPRIRSVKGLAATPFDVINMQFALHYFFESPATVKACLDNINMQLADGGLFIGTCFDGQLVDQMFENNENSDVLEGRKNGGVIWRIRKKYEGPFDPKTKAGVGKKISVLFETIDVNEKDEYLVGFDYLVNELKKRNIRLLSKTECIEMKLSRYQSHGSFRELFEDMVKRYGRNMTNPMSENNDKTVPQGLKPAFNMTEDEKRYSFLNKWFVFKKDSHV